MNEYSRYNAEQTLTKSTMRLLAQKQKLQLLIVTLLGCLTVLGFAPFYLYLVPVITTAGLLYFWQQASSPRQAAWLGFSFGLGLFVSGIYWIYISLHDFGGMPPLGAGFATLCLCAFMALFTAVIGWLGKKSGALLYAVPLLWALSDWVRSWIFTGFPWLTIGYTQVPASPLAAYAPVFGIYGVTLVTLLSAAMLVMWINSTAAPRKIVMSLLLLWLSGILLKQVEWSKPVGEPTSVALLQGNITQDLKWQEDEAQRTLDKYYQLSTSTDAKLIVMPETALPMLFNQIPSAYMDALTRHAVKQQGDILVGTVEYEEDQYYNSMVSTGASAMQAYRKSHLVPFGEFIPLKGIFGWVYRDWLNIPLTDLARGGFEQRPLSIAGQQVAVNICYEDVFGEEITYQLPQATLLVNTSNDAWYGDSLAAYQHLQISQARALETARMMLRATNTGATAIIDRDGGLIAHLPHFTTGVLRGEAQGYTGSTPYVYWGNWPMVLLCLLGIVLLWGRKKK